MNNLNSSGKPTEEGRATISPFFGRADGTEAMCIVLPLPNLLKGLEIMNEEISMKDRNLPTG